MALVSLNRLQQYSSRLRAKYVDGFVFVHINKTGGSSIEKALRLPFQHRTALELREHLGRDRWQRRFSFAFVRNPWDKVASHYFYRVKTNQTGLATVPVEFNEWVRRAYGERDPQYYDKPKMFLPQVDWISDEEGRQLVGFVGRFERLQADFRIVCERIGIDADLPHEKQSSNRDYRRVYTPASADIVAQWFAADIERFGYTLE
jgi:chondroitin 4-sulfotransferase 11